MRYTKEQFKEQYNNLPSAIADFMSSEETTDKVLGIGEKYNFHIDQLGTLSEEVSLVLVGLEDLRNFHANLQKSLGISEDIANLVTYDLNQQIFSKIREQLQQRPQEMPTMSAPPAKEVQTPTPTSSPKQTFQEKMGGISNVPKQEVEVETKTGDNETREVEKKPARDPYREPIN